MIGKFLAPYEAYLWAALAVVVMIGSILLVHHIEQIGVDRQKAADAKLVAAQVVHKEEVEKRAQELVSAQGQQLHNALVAPDPQPAIVVRVCPSFPGGKHVVPADVRSVSGGPAIDAGSPGVGSGSDQTGVDIAPVTEGILKRQDAEIAYWRSYYATCKAQGICK